MGKLASLFEKFTHKDVLIADKKGHTKEGLARIPLWRLSELARATVKVFNNDLVAFLQRRSPRSSYPGSALQWVERPPKFLVKGGNRCLKSRAGTF